MRSQALGGSPTDEDALNYLVARAAGSYRASEEFVYMLLKESILTGMFRPGMRLRQDDLAKVLGVSRIPVRTALYRLQGDGLVMLKPNRGAVVRVLSKAEVEEIYRLRVLLETDALRRSAASIDVEKFRLLRQLSAQMDELAEGAELLKVRSSFYRALYDEQANPTTVHLIEQLRSMIGTQVLGRKVAREKEHGHQPVLTLLERGDVDGAVAWLRTHLENVCAEIMEIMNSEQVS